MPQLIIVVPDGDILRFIDYFNFGISHIIGSCIDWLIRNINCAIEAKKDEWHKWMPGLLSGNEPKVLWVLMPNQPNGRSPLLAACNKFNAILENIVATRKSHYTIDINDKLNQTQYYLIYNQLNGRGQDVLWMEVDRMIECFDYHKLPYDPVTNRPLAATAKQLPYKY